MQHYSVLEGLTVNAIGDSYIAPSDKQFKWPDLLRDKYHMELYNEGIGGSTVSSFVTNRNPMCERYDRLPENSPHVVIIEGGRNDFNNRVPLGDAATRDPKTYSGALNVIADALRAKYPKAMFVFISVWNFPNKPEISLTYRDYANAMHAVADGQNAYFIEACNEKESLVDMSDREFRARYSKNADDPSHLNEDGMRLVFPFFERRLAECYTDFVSKQ